MIKSLKKELEGNKIKMLVHSIGSSFPTLQSDDLKTTCMTGLKHFWLEHNSEKSLAKVNAAVEFLIPSLRMIPSMMRLKKI